MEADKGVEQQELGTEVVQSFAEALLVLMAVEPERRGSNDLDVELGQVEPIETTDAFKSLSHDNRSIFGNVEEHAACLGDGEVP